MCVALPLPFVLKMYFEKVFFEGYTGRLIG